MYMYIVHSIGVVGTSGEDANDSDDKKLGKNDGNWCIGSFIRCYY